MSKRQSLKKRERMMNEIEALAILAHTPGLGPVKGRQLVEKFGTAAAAVGCELNACAPISGLSPLTVSSWGWWKKDLSWKKELDLAVSQGVELIPYRSSSFPEQLLKIRDHPLLLWVKGDLGASLKTCIAVVGTRNASLYGQEMAESISAELAAQGVTVVSGLARGIDTKAHLGALKTGRTLAVLGSGLANIYPKENRLLAEKISERGALISEFPMSAPPEKYNFPKRNRIVSGLSLGTLLIEAPLKSGAMITMDMAKNQNKKLFVLPGRADLETFKGNHRLIKEGGATLVECGTDILLAIGNQLNLNDLNNKMEFKGTLLDKEERELLQKMPKEELSIEDLVKITNLSIIKLNILLMGLVLKQAVKEYPGKIYKKGF